MAKAIEINGNDFERIVYRGEPVVTLPMVDKLHQKGVGRAYMNFRRNREKFKEDKDYIIVPYREWSKILNRKTWGGHRTSMIFLFQSGYMLLVKSLRDGLAWTVQQKMSRSYFIKPSLSQDVRKILEYSIHRKF